VFQWEIIPTPLKQPNTVGSEHARHFPDEDLIPFLVEKYFTEVNIQFPLLHRPTFELDIANGLHLREEGFASVLLLVSAIAARYVTDKRVLFDGENDPASAGWKWFHQVDIVKKMFWTSPQLTDLQVCMVSVQRAVISEYVIYLRCETVGCYVPAWEFKSSSVVDHRWYRHPICPRHRSASPKNLQIVNHPGRRVAEEGVLVGKFISKTNPHLMHFRCLISVDRWISRFLGRPSAMQDEE
jgi:hypothetical protein